jgi:hypothetical protein
VVAGQRPTGGDSVRRLAPIATIIGGLCWMEWCLSVLGAALHVGPLPFANVAILASPAFLALGSAGSLITGAWGGGRVLRLGFAAIALGGLATIALGGMLAVGWSTGSQVASAIGLWLVLGGSIAIGSQLRRLGGLEGDRGVRGTATALGVTSLALVGLAFLSQRGPVGIFNLDGASTIGKIFALVELAFGGSWAWLGWRAFERPPTPATSEDRVVGRRTWISALVGSSVVGVIVVGAGWYWAGATHGPAGPPVEAAFEGTGGEEQHPLVFPGGDARFDWDIRDCGTTVSPYDVLAIDLYRMYDADHTPDPGLPWFLGGGSRMGVGLAQLIVGQEYGTGGPVAGTTSMHVDGGLWSLHVEMPGSCHWKVAVRSPGPSQPPP